MHGRETGHLHLLLAREDGKVIFCFVVELGAQMPELGSRNARKVLESITACIYPKIGHLYLFIAEVGQGTSTHQAGLRHAGGQLAPIHIAT